MWGYVTMAALVLDRHRDRTRRHRAGTIGSRGGRDRHRNGSCPRASCAATGAFSEFLLRKDALAALAFVVLFKFTDAFSGTMTAPFVIDLGFSRNDYAAIVKGVGLAATLIGGFAGGFVARRYSLAASLWIGGITPGGRQSLLLLARLGRRQPLGVWCWRSRRKTSPARSAP